MINYGLQIKKIRESLNIKQEVLAKKLNISKSALSMYENGQRQINIEFFDTILKELNSTSTSEINVDNSVCTIENILNKINSKIDNKSSKTYLEKLYNEMFLDGWTSESLGGRFTALSKDIRTKEGKLVMVQLNDCGDCAFIVKDVEAPNEYLSLEKYMKYENEDTYYNEYHGEDSNWVEIISYDSVNSKIKINDDIFTKENNKYLKEKYSKFILHQ